MMVDNILQAYKDASALAGQGAAPEMELAAYKKVIDIGQQLNNPEDKKSQTVMFWAYNNIQDVLLKKESLKSWLKLKLEDANKLPQSQRRKAFQILAENCPEDNLQVLFYEKALDFIFDEENSFEEKCCTILEIGSALSSLYRKMQKKSDYRRIWNLMQKTAYLAVSEIEMILDEESNRERKQALLARLFELEEAYLQPSLERQVYLCRRLNDVLDGDEYIEVFDKIYNKKILSDFLRRVMRQ